MARSDTERRRTNDEPPTKKKKANDQIETKTGGAYIPPAKLRMLQQQITDKQSVEYQRLSWEALKKSINGLANKVNKSNIKDIVQELFQENIVRGRGILARSILLAQNASPTFTQVYAALTAIINSRFPQNGELVLRRVVSQFRKSFRRNQKDTCLHSVQFIAHLINQQVAHEILGLQILTLMLETPTDDSVEVAVGFLKECGQKLGELSPRGLAAVFERLRVILHEQQLEKRVQYMIEVMFAIRKDGFKEHPSMVEELDLVDESDQFTHMLTIDDDNVKGLEMELNVFRVDPEFQESEENYKQIKKDILDQSSEGSGSSGSSSESSDDEEEEIRESSEEDKTVEIEDRTETNLVALRRTIYLAIQSSLSYEECAHKILKMEFSEKDYGEICAMIIDCASQQRTYEKFFGLLGGRFCLLKKEFMEQFETLFKEQYDTIHRLETNKLRNVAKFFAHLLHSDSLPWSVLSHIVITEDTTTSSSRIFIKILFQEIAEYMGITKLNERLKDPTLAPFYEGLFPRDNPKNSRFSINFFTSIGLGGVTDELREHLKNSTYILSQKLQAEQLAALAAGSSSSSSSSSSDDESSDSTSSSDSDAKKKKKSKKMKRKSKKTSKKKSSKKSKRKRKKITMLNGPTSKDRSVEERDEKSSDDEREQDRRRERSPREDEEYRRLEDDISNKIRSERTRHHRGSEERQMEDRRSKREGRQESEKEGRRSRREKSVEKEKEERRSRRVGSEEKDMEERTSRRRGRENNEKKERQSRRNGSVDKEKEEQRTR
uniref:Pre-mRNA-splicing factor CWC22 homolog n=1 Tax=Ciona intestinalis TaxID=7719 RepID=F6R2U8_CIOIN